MGDNTIDAYLGAFKSGGARQYLFLVWFAFPKEVADKLNPNLSYTNLPYYVRTTSLPESSYEDISIPYPGYNFKMAGTRIYNDWSISMNIDTGANLLKLFQEWHNLIYNPETHNYSYPLKYMVTQKLELLGPDLNPVSEYKLYGAWPRSIGNVQLDYSSTELATVDITFAYQYYMRYIPHV
jgi:hypothetical protein